MAPRPASFIYHLAMLALSNMVFVTFLVPMGVYLVILGLLHRRGQPLVVSGTFDLIGLLFGLSGFVIVGGPAILSSLHERWRLWWLLGDPGAPREPLDTYFPLWVACSVLYFFVVLGGVVWLFRHYRALTSIYGIEPQHVPSALSAACQQLNLSLRPLAERRFLIESPEGAATVDVEPFDLMSNVTLRWSPAATGVRRPLEEALARELEDAPPPEHDVGLWLCSAGLLLMSFAVLILFVLIMRPTYP